MLPQQKKNYALQEHFLKASLWCIQGQIISLTIFHHWKCFFKSLVVPKIWYRVHQKKELWETVWIFYCTIAFSGMGPLKSSSNVMGRSILVHTSLSRNALSGAPHKFLFLLISHLSLSFPDFMDGLEPGFKPPAFFTSISASFLGQNLWVWGGWEASRTAVVNDCHFSLVVFPIKSCTARNILLKNMPGNAGIRDMFPSCRGGKLKVLEGS